MAAAELLNAATHAPFKVGQKEVYLYVGHHCNPTQTMKLTCTLDQCSR